MKLLTLTIIYLFVALSGTVVAYEVPSRLGEGLGGTVLITDPTAGDCLNTPGLMNSHNGLSIEVGYDRQFEMKELDDRYVSAAYRRGKFGFAGGLSQFGLAELYTETRLHGALAMSWRRWSVGLSGTAMLVEFGGPYDNVWTSSLDAGATMRCGRALLALSVKGIKSPHLSDRVDPSPQWVTLYGELIGSGAFSTLARVTVENDQRPQFAVGQALFVSNDAWLLWSVSTAPIKYGGGIQVSRGSLRGSWTTSYHPDLGFSHTVGLSFDFHTSRE